MKQVLLAVATITFMVSCNKKVENETNVDAPQISYQVFGDSISAEGALSKDEMLAKYQTMSLTDTLEVKFTSEIISTCKKKGCWMTLNLAEGKETFVKFKDYAFFVPKEGAENHATIIAGKAFITETSVDELKHYAKDAGKTEEEIATITEPKVEYRFMADGVLIAENN